MKNPLLRCLLLLAALPGAMARPAEAAWPHDNPGGNLPVCTATDAQTPGRAASDGAGGMIVAWADSRDGSYNTDIYAQRVSVDGTLLWAADGIPVCAASGAQLLIAPGAQSDGAGGAIILWQDNGKISAQRIDGSGAALWAAGGVVVVPSVVVVNSAPVACSDGAGGAIVVWCDGSTSPTRLLAQRVLADGTTPWGATPVQVCNVGGPSSPKIAEDGANGAYVAWLGSPDVSNPSVFVQRLDGSGTPQWGENGIAFTEHSSYFPELAADGSGGAFLASRPGGGPLTAQRIDSNGNKLWGSDGDTLAAGNNPVSAAIAADGAGNGYFGWVETAQLPWVIRAQRINGAGTKQWPDTAVVVCDTTYERGALYIGPDASGGLLLAWSDDRDDIYGDIYAQRLDASGVGQWTPQGVPVSTNPWGQGSVSFVLDNTGGVILVWRDKRNNNTADVYAQRIDGFGYLGNPEPVISSVLDVPDDHGGMVNVSWDASYLDPPGGTIVDYEVSRLDLDWTAVGTLSASGASGYSLAVPTTVDSSGSGSGLTSYRVEARTAGSPSWFSAAASGYSVDNLGTASVPPAMRPRLALDPPSPNPAGAAVSIRWSLDRSEPARLALFDLGGRLVRTLYEGEALGGPHTTTLDAHAVTGALPAGIYLVRLDAEGRTLSQRVAIVR